MRPKVDPLRASRRFGAFAVLTLRAIAKIRAGKMTAPEAAKHFAQVGPDPPPAGDRRLRSPAGGHAHCPATAEQERGARYVGGKVTNGYLAVAGKPAGASCGRATNGRSPQTQTLASDDPGVRLLSPAEPGGTFALPRSANAPPRHPKCCRRATAAREIAWLGYTHTDTFTGTSRFEKYNDFLGLSA